MVYSAELWFSAHTTQRVSAGTLSRDPRCYNLTFSRCYQTGAEPPIHTTSVMKTVRCDCDYPIRHSREIVTEEMRKKINHLVTLARSLLPSGSEPPQLPSKLQKLIEDNDFDTPSLMLRQVRDLTFHAGAHEHSWYERNVPPCKFSVGDLGYVPRGKAWNSFVLLGNVFERDAEALKVSFKANGEYWCWENVPIRRQPLQAFEMPMNISGCVVCGHCLEVCLQETRWPVAVPPYRQTDVAVVHEAFAACVQDAWRYLLENAKQMAQDAGIKPEDIVLGETSSYRPTSERFANLF